MLKAFAPIGVDKEQIFGLLGVKGLDDISYESLMFLAGILGSIKNGDQKAEVVFSIDNMVNPGQVRPPQPQRSEFRQEDRGGGKKTVAAEDPKQKDAPAQAETPAVEKQQEQPAAQPDARELERQEFIRDAYVELEGQTKIIDNKTGGGVSPLRERIIDAGVMNADEEVTWTQACDDKAKAIMDAAKKPRK